MRRYSDKAGLRTLSEINVTPLIDLAFTLLIIFMILTPLLDKSMELRAPTSRAATTEIDPNKVRMLTVDRERRIAIDSDPIEQSALESRMRELREAGEADAVVVKAHRDLPIQQLVDIMDSLQRAGVTRVGVVTREPDTESSNP